MMDIENGRNDDDIAIYIDELKCDDPNLKLNAVTKIVDIARILGPVRTREELVPYLTEIIEECDNDDEFLIKLAENLVHLKDHVGGPEQVQCLLSPLEFISSIEEPTIRETAISSAKKLAENQTPEFFTKPLYEMLKRLVMWDNYTSKISGISLIPICYRNIKSEEHAGLKAAVNELAKDDTPMVRRAVAGILGELSSIYDPESFVTDIKPIIYEFLSDDVDSVKIKALEQVSAIAKLIDQNERDNTLLNVILQMDAEKRNWRIRYHLPDALGGVVQYLSQDVITGKVIPFYQGLLKDNEHEVRSNALTQLTSFAKTVKTLTSGNLEHIAPIFDTIKELLEDKSHHVRISLVNVLSTLGDCMTEKFINEDLVTILVSILKDPIIDGKIAGIRNFSALLPLIPVKIIKESILTEFKTLGTGSNWKIRFEVLKSIPCLLHSKQAELVEEFIAINDLFKDDHIFCIRERIVTNLVESCAQSYHEALDSIIINLGTYWSGCSNYIYRVSSLQLASRLSTVAKREVFEKLYALVFDALKDDKVPNVKINHLRLVNEVLAKPELKEIAQKSAEQLFPINKDFKDADVILLMELIKEKLN